MAVDLDVFVKSDFIYLFKSLDFVRQVFHCHIAYLSARTKQPGLNQWCELFGQDYIVSKLQHTGL